MGSTVWKGQLTFGLVSFPVRLVRAARKERIPLRYVRERQAVPPVDEEYERTHVPRVGTSESSVSEEQWNGAENVVAPVRQAYIAADEPESIPAGELQRGYEVAPGQFAVIKSEELRRLRQPTSAAMEILRSVHMEEIDAVFFETSYYVAPGPGGDHSYNLFYRALKDSGYAALAEVAMHGRQHFVVIRAGQQGLIAHTMYYMSEVRSGDEHVTQTSDVVEKELELAKKFVEAIAAPFRPEEFTDRYRQELESLIASKEALPLHTTADAAGRNLNPKVIDIMEALRKSLESVRSEKASARKPATAAGKTPAKPRRRRA